MEDSRSDWKIFIDFYTNTFLYFKDTRNIKVNCSRPNYRVIVEENVPATMRDGTTLYADVYRPDASDRFPALLTRTPYNKKNADIHNVNLIEWAAERGYILVIQDVRGRYASDGEFHPMFLGGRFEALDGYDTVEWVASLPYCNGKIGTFGCSYDSWTQWELSRTRPPHLVAMFAGGQATRSTDWERGGIFRTERALQWLINTLAPDTRRRVKGIGPWTEDESWKIWKMNKGKWIWFLPLKDIPDEILGDLASPFREWLRNHHVDYWRFHEKHGEISVPVFHYTGWYDRLNGTIDHYTGMVKNGGTEQASRNQKLLIGPWSHGNKWRRKIGDVDFGPEAEVDYRELMIRWFDFWLKGIDNGIMNEPRIKIFVMGANTWRSEREWPLARTCCTDYYIHSEGNANTPQRNGILSPNPPENEPPDNYIYDPRDPVMSLYMPDAQDAPMDQRLLDHRMDVLRFVSEPLTKKMEVTGNGVVKLWASSSAQDTDFTAKLIDVHADGFAQNLCYGIIRTRFRKSLDAAKLIKPGEIYEYTIELQPTSNLFHVGHSIRLDISSSDFPNFDRNHNTGVQDWESPEMVSATQTIYHDKMHPSKVIIPIIP